MEAASAPAAFPSFFPCLILSYLRPSALLPHYQHRFNLQVHRLPVAEGVFFIFFLVADRFVGLFV